MTLVRHGETEWNRALRVQGTTDIPLNDTGRAQALEAAVELRKSLGDMPVFLASSDLSRARETAEIIGAELGLEGPRQYPSLRERAYGDGEGLTAAEFAERWGPWHSADVPGSEKRDDLRERAVRGLLDVVEHSRAASSPIPMPVIIVSHGALIREVIRHATGGVLPPDGSRLANGSRWRFLVERDRLRFLSDDLVFA